MQINAPIKPPDVGDKVDYILPIVFGDSSHGPKVYGVATVMDIEPDGGLHICVPFDYGAHPDTGLKGRTSFELIHVRNWDDPANSWLRLYGASWRLPTPAAQPTPG